MLGPRKGRVSRCSRPGSLQHFSGFRVPEFWNSPFSVFLTQTGPCVPPMNRDIPEVFLTGGDLVPQGYAPRRCLSVVETGSQPEEEEEGGIRTEGDGSYAVPLRRSRAFRTHNHTYDPFKRHSWGPGRELQDPLSR